MKLGEVFSLAGLVIVGAIAWAFLYSTIKSDIVNSLPKCCDKCECERGKR